MPYIFRPYRLAEQMTNQIDACVALLHDVAEDTEVTIKALERELSPDVTEAVHMLTHDPSVNCFQYFCAVCTKPVAVTVKLADPAHNSDETRFAGCDTMPAEKLAAHHEKYVRTRAAPTA